MTAGPGRESWPRVRRRADAPRTPAVLWPFTATLSIARVAMMDGMRPLEKNCQREGCSGVHTRCNGHNRQRLPCMRWPRKGSTVCPRHGGMTPNALRSAKENVAKAEYEKAMQGRGRNPVTYGDKKEVSAIDALLDEVHWTAGHVEWLRKKVQETEEADLVKGITKVVRDNEGSETSTTETAPNIWLNLYDRERKHFVTVCTAALKAGIEERLIKQAERVGETLVRILDLVFEDPELNLNKTQKRAVPNVVERGLRLLSDERRPV